MKQKNKLSVILITLAVTALFAVLAGNSFLNMVQGPAPFQEYSSLEEAADHYLSYDVTYPVASFPAEYYSGDPDRVRRTAYVVYDETYEIFIKIVVPENGKSGLERLLRNIRMPDAVKQEWSNPLEEELRPVLITGTLSPISDSSKTEEIWEALTDPDSEITESMTALAFSQKDWYVLEDEYINGLSIPNIAICVAAVGMNLLFLIIALLSLLGGAKKDAALQNTGGSLSRFFELLKQWLAPWCSRGRKRHTKVAVLSILGAALGACLIGYLTGASFKVISTCHLPLGLMAGELYGLTLLLSMGIYTPEKNLKLYLRAMEKLVPAQRDLEEIAQDLLEEAGEWSVHESGKDGFHHAVAGKRYWAFFCENGRVALVDSAQVKRIKSEVDSGQIRVGRVRTSYTYYRVYFYFQEPEGKHPDQTATFYSSEASGHFLTLLRKRLGDQAEHIMK